MPKIVRNEIEYSSTTSTANQIHYNNTVSGLSATNVQGAIDEVNNSQKPAAYINVIGDKTADAWDTSSGSNYSITSITDAFGNNISYSTLWDTAHNMLYDVYFIYKYTPSSGQQDEYTYKWEATRYLYYINMNTVRIEWEWQDSSNRYVMMTIDGSTITCTKYPLPTNKAAASGGTDTSLVTTGEKYSWDNPTYLLDKSWGTKTYVNYGAAELPISSITWLAGWNGYELRGVNKNQISVYMHLYTSEIKKSTSGTTVTFTVGSWTTEGYILLIGEANGYAILSILAIHNNNVRELKNLGYTISVSASGNTLTVTLPQWSNLQAISNFTIS